MVANTHRRTGLGTRLVATARHHAAQAGCEWLPVDFDPELRSFYIDACGFRPTSAGLIELADDDDDAKIPDSKIPDSMITDSKVTDDR